MTLSEFKSIAVNRGNFYDNAKKAGDAWSKSWGLTWWRDLWAYKMFTIGNLTYKSGRVHTRHTSYSVVECFIDDKQVSPTKFSKYLDTFVAPQVTEAEQKYIDECNARAEAQMMARRRRQAQRASKTEVNRNPAQLVINFDVA